VRVETRGERRGWLLGQAGGEAAKGSEADYVYAVVWPMMPSHCGQTGNQLATAVDHLSWHSARDIGRSWVSLYITYKETWTKKGSTRCPSRKSAYQNTTISWPVPYSGIHHSSGHVCITQGLTQQGIMACVVSQRCLCVAIIRYVQALYVHAPFAHCRYTWRST
jgi:hypothetical protein